MPRYDPSFFAKVREGARASARAVVPLVLELVRPRSVIDVGCGDGTWLAEFRAAGVPHVLGIDGDYVDRAQLAIPADRFRPRDLRLPFDDLDERFDLVVSLEVAEHLPPECADGFVHSLTSLGAVVLFSAAIPSQRGTHHVNEQWQDFWVRRFAAHGFVAIDGLRTKLWDNESVEWWYAQNTMLYAHRDRLASDAGLQHAHELGASLPPRIVHPRAYQAWVDECALQKSWARRMFQIAQELAPLVPRGAMFVLVDDAQFEPWAVPDGRRALPFLEHEGQFWGPPADDVTALAELERMRAAGATHIAFGWPAFWWLEHYHGFHEALRTRFACVLENERVVAFDLQQDNQPVARPR